MKLRLIFLFFIIYINDINAQSTIIAKYEFTEIFNGIDTIHLPLKSEFIFQNSGFVLLANDKELLDFVVPYSSLYENFDARAFGDTRKTYLDSASNQNCTIYEAFKYKTQILLVFLNTDIKIVKKNKTYIKFYNIK